MQVARFRASAVWERRRSCLTKDGITDVLSNEEAPAAIWGRTGALFMVDANFSTATCSANTFDLISQ